MDSQRSWGALRTLDSSEFPGRSRVAADWKVGCGLGVLTQTCCLTSQKVETGGLLQARCQPVLHIEEGGGEENGGEGSGQELSIPELFCCLGHSSLAR